MRSPRTIEEFQLADHEGETWTLRGQLARGPVGLLTFRGTWCPFSVRTWRCLGAVADDIAATGIPLLGISADEPWTLAGFRMRLDLPWRLLSDPQLVTSRRLGVPRGQRHPRARTYPAGAFLQPGFVIVAPGGTVLHEWLPTARERDSLGGGDRPVPAEIVAALRRATPQTTPAAPARRARAAAGR